MRKQIVSRRSPSPRVMKRKTVQRICKDTGSPSEAGSRLGSKPGFVTRGIAQLGAWAKKGQQSSGVANQKMKDNAEKLLQTKRSLQPLLHELERNKEESKSKYCSFDIPGNIVLISVKASFADSPDVQLPMWKPSCIPENATVDKIIRLWAERVFGKTMSTKDLPPHIRCYAGSETGRRLHHRYQIRQIKRFLPVVDGRHCISIVWPHPKPGTAAPGIVSTTPITRDSWIVKRKHGDDGAVSIEFAKAAALLPGDDEANWHRTKYVCYASLRDQCMDANCPYPHPRPKPRFVGSSGSAGAGRAQVMLPRRLHPFNREKPGRFRIGGA